MLRRDLLPLLAVMMAVVAQNPCAAFWFFRSSGRQAAQGPISEDCVAKAQRGDCHFYTCFDQRHHCEDDNYALDYGLAFCSRYEHNLARFNWEGRRWVNETRRCSMGHMLTYYRQSHINCANVEHDMKHAHAQCEVDHGFCNFSVLQQNEEVFKSIYTFNRRAIVRFLVTVKHCSRDTLRQVAAWFGDNVMLLVSLLREVNFD